MSSEREASDLYRVRKTLCQMLNDRGYIIGEDDLTLTLEEFKQQFSDDDNKIVREKCQITTCLNDDSTDQLFAFFPNAAEKLGKSAIEPYLQQMKQEEVKRAILVLQQQPTSFAASQIKSTDDFTIEVFSDLNCIVTSIYIK